MWLPSTTISHSGTPSTGNGSGLTDPTEQEVYGLAASRWRAWWLALGLLMAMAWTERVTAQSTIIIAKKAQSETAGQTFGFTSNIPGVTTFNLTDNAAYIPLQDVGVGNNNKVWVVQRPATPGATGAVYSRVAGTTAWTALAGANANRLDADASGTVYLASSGQLFSSSGGALTSHGGTSIVDVGVSAGATQPVYVLAGAGPCYTLYRYNGGGTYTAFTGICGSRLDVSSDGTVWMLGQGGTVIYQIAISGTTATIAGTYPGTYADITVAADGTVWASTLTQSYRKTGSSFVLDPNSGGTGTMFGGISAGSDGDAPFLTYNAGYIPTYTSESGRLVQRTENGTWLDDHAVNVTNGNTVIYNVAPGTYTITENSPPSPWQLTNITTSGGTVSADISTRTATVTVSAGQTSYIEFDNANIINSVVSNSCGAPYVETFGAAGTTVSTFGAALPNGYTSYHYDGSGTSAAYGAGQYSIVNNAGKIFIADASYEDHTPGDIGGNFMFINGGFAKDEFFRRRFSGLAPGVTYFLSIYAMGFNANTVLPNLLLEARKTDGTLIGSTTTGDIPLINGRGAWQKFQLQFTADASGIADFIVRNNQQLAGIYGNDLAIDDITIGVGCDFGDAPDTYKTTIANGGPSHKGSASLRMGSLIDIETDGFPSTANGDNLDNTDDEDAVSFGVLCTATTSLTALVVNVNNTGAPTARIIGWIDFNQNGVFDPSEGTTVAAGSGGNYTLTWTGITGLVAGTTYARIRLTSDPAITVNTPGGSANDGEVEDYQIVINPGGGTITASPTALTTCSGDPVSINYTTSPVGQNVQWVRMPGNITGGMGVVDSPTATGTTPVSYTYTAIIADIYGCPSNVATTIVTVNPVPVITPSVCSQTICSGQTGAITFTSSVSATINWLRVEDGATGTGDISQLFATAGTFTYKIWGVSAAPASCPSSTTITCTIVVNNCCSLTVTASASQTAVCVGQAVTLATSISGNAGAVTYFWTGPNGFTSNAANPTLPAATTATAGMYTVFVTDPTASTSCVKTATVTLNVGSLYVAASSNSPVCTTGSLSLTGIAAGGNGSYTFSWTGPNGFVSAVQNPTLALSTTAQSGNYNLLVTDTQGCSGTATTTVTVATQPSLSITAGSGLTICSGQSTTLNVAGSNGAPVSWTNSLGQTGTGTTITSGTLVNAGTAPMVVTYVISASTASCSDVEIVQVVVNPEPVLQVVPNASIICNLEQTNVTATAYPATASITWTRTPTTPNPPAASGSGTGSVTINQVLPPATYTYTFTATNGGCSSTLPATVAITVQP
ncbi:beta strand repeat-containing protein [Larkinella sp. GY13]|uniref:beta strand repeat-containing protein n=1 Tax=Larkinella sp. GY13 TaxID=3453720 RepID=UPI003EEECCF1